MWDPRRAVFCCVGALSVVGAIEGRWAPHLEDIQDLVGDVDPSLGADLLHDEIHREQRSEVIGSI